MPKITINESGCRGCSLCVEICPTDVLEMDSGNDLAKIKCEDDCIGCTSCMYICPSRCLEITDFLEQRPFYRIEENLALISKFLQKKPAISSLLEEDYREALLDLSTRLIALSGTMAETVGRGQKALGRRCGVLAATHLPEMYEGTTVDTVLDKLKSRFTNCFPFESQIAEEGNKIIFEFDGCALKGVVERAGQQPGESTLCQVFHEYWAGLLGMFVDKKFQVHSLSVNRTCKMNFEAV